MPFPLSACDRGRSMRIAIIGGGLAGAFLALQLKDSGHQVSLFDPRAPWEKPCGGAVSAGVLNQFPILGELSCGWHRPSNLKFLPSACEEDSFVGPQSTWLMVSRYDLNRAILEEALRTRTVSLTADRVNDIRLKRDGLHWLVRTACDRHEFDVVVGADGVNSVVRKRLMGPFPPEHLSLAVGYMVRKAPLDEMLFRTYSDLLGYLWYLPRSDHASVGIVTRANATPVSDLWRRLDAFLDRYCPQGRKVRRWRALIPSAIKPGFWRSRCSGQNWALIGDAAGHVDPLTGIGIPYALASSTLVARAILREDLGSYDRTWRDQYGHGLEQSSRMMQRFVGTGDVTGFERWMEEMCLLAMCPWLSALGK